MKKIVVSLLISLVLLLSIVLIYIRKPTKPTPIKENNDQQVEDINEGWKKYSFEKIGLSFSAPSDMVVSEDQTNQDNFTFTVQRGSYPNPDYYQLYAFLQPTANMDNDAEGLKSQLQEDSKDVIIGGFQAIKGQYKGERARYVTFIFTDKGILNLATSQPTLENERITDSILDTFTFNKEGGNSFTSPTTDQAIQAILAKKYNKQLSEVAVKVNKEVPGFAAGSVLFGQGGPGEGGMWLAVLGNGWEVVWDGNGSVDCNKMRQVYGFPDVILKPNFCD